jgi:uncharacterized protein involved in response to NO
MAAIVRSIGVALFPAQFFMMIDLSAGLWMLAFLLFIYHFGRMLITPRVDGHPG